MKLVTKGALALMLGGWLGFGAMEAMAGSGEFCPPFSHRGPIHTNMIPARHLYRGPEYPIAYRHGRSAMPVAWAPAGRSMPFWGAPRLASQPGWVNPARSRPLPYPPPYAMGAPWMAQRPYAMQPQMAARPMAPVGLSPYAQQVNRPVRSIDPLPGRHWVAAR